MRHLVTPRGCPSYSDGIHRLTDLGRSEMHMAWLRQCNCGVNRIYRTDEAQHSRYRAIANRDPLMQRLGDLLAMQCVSPDALVRLLA